MRPRSKKINNNTTTTRTTTTTKSGRYWSFVVLAGLVAFQLYRDAPFAIGRLALFESNTGAFVKVDPPLQEPASVETSHDPVAHQQSSVRVTQSDEHPEAAAATSQNEHEESLPSQESSSSTILPVHTPAPFYPNIAVLDNSRPLPGEKIINFYTDFTNFGDNQNTKNDNLLALGRNDFHFLQCPVRNCFAVANPNMTDADAYVMYSTELLRSHLSKVASFRKPHQRFVFLQTESPLIGTNDKLETYNHFFNWTMTYRQDSDIRYQYGNFEPIYSKDAVKDKTWSIEYNEERQWPFEYNEQHFATEGIFSIQHEKDELVNRPGGAAWIVSNCHDNSKRKEFALSLQKHFPVDIYGRSCPTIRNMKKCDAGKRWDQPCVKGMQRQYKFYLALENSFCDDYATEKFFNRVDEGYLPVVMGGANYTQLAPPHSYIDALDFSSIKELADYLVYLQGNETAYLSYFWWRRYYRVNPYAKETFGFCDLCAKLNDPKEPNKSYDDIDEWWQSKSRCGQKLPIIEAMLE